MQPGPAERDEAAGRTGLTARDELARRQLSLVNALVARGTPPAGVDPGRVRIQADALTRKRSRSVAARAPALAAALGSDFWPAFQDYDATRTGPPPAGSAAGARDFARFLTTAAGRSHTTPEIRRAVRALLRPRWLSRLTPAHSFLGHHSATRP
jgi:hypothetical protein